MAKVCAACSKINDDNAKFCRGCGGALAAAPAIAPSEQTETPVKQCPSCQKPNKAGAKFCLGCGHRFGTPLSPVIKTAEVPLAPLATMAPRQDVFANANSELASRERPPQDVPPVPKPFSPQLSGLDDNTSKPVSTQSPPPPPPREAIPAKVTPLHSDRRPQPLPPLPPPIEPPQSVNDVRPKPSKGGAVPAGPAESNEGKSNTVIIAVGAIVLAAVVAGGAYWYLNKSKEVPAAEATKTTPASTPIAPPTSPLEPGPTANQPTQSTIVQDAEPQKPDAQSQQLTLPNPVDPRPEPSTTPPSSSRDVLPAKPVGQAIAPLAAPKPIPPKLKPLAEKAKRQEPPPPVQDSKKSAEDLRKQIEDELRGIPRK